MNSIKRIITEKLEHTVYRSLYKAEQNQVKINLSRNINDILYHKTFRSVKIHLELQNAIIFNKE